MSAAALGVAVAGLGVGEAHARAFAADSRCRLLWLYDLDRGKADALRPAVKASGTAGSFEQVLADPAVQAVSIASYDDAHFGQARSALDAGKHVFVEKPLCRTLEELRALKKSWSLRKPQLASNLLLRAAPLFRWLKDEIAAGELGKIYSFDGDYLYGRLGKITEGWRKNVENYSVMQGGGVHLVDLMLWLTGQRPSSVSACGNRIASAGTAFRYDDFVAADYRFPSGLIGRITANFGCVHRHQHALRVFGTKATFLYDDAGARLHRFRDDSKPERIDLAPAPSGKGELIPDFIAAVLSGAPPQARAQREFDVIAACAAADLACRSEKNIPVEYI